jgi:hypothetical protein
MPLSPEMQDRITHHVTASIARRRVAGVQKDIVHALIMACLVEADDDHDAGNLLALAEDRQRRGDDSAIARVFSGRVDLVALLDLQGE